jgi:DNA polymerase-3 subunit beta
MAQQDVRYYLNGLLLEFSPSRVRAVATDGHRLALSEFALETGVEKSRQWILPRKAVLELQRLVDQGDEVALELSASQIAGRFDNIRLISKVIDGRFPDYERDSPERILTADRERVKAALSRVAILSNEKFRGVRLLLSEGALSIQSQNPDQEEAEEELDVAYTHDPLEIGFNVVYLLDALNAMDSSEFLLELRGSDGSGLLRDAMGGSSRYVVMPMRL